MRAVRVLLMAAALSAAGLGTGAQTPPPNVTSEQDHQQMMDQLGIRRLRPGVNSDAAAPVNPANYDEARANPWPDYPDPLTRADGGKVATAAEWREKRRPELIETFEREIYGRVPRTAPKVTW